jgi:isoleucyl-tRNA synthetase/very-short-patch-repair endonuclease/RimJ/RimL family protein N-acetyltransferase
LGGVACINARMNTASHTSSAHYPTITSDVDFAALERDVLAFWKEQRVFEASVAGRAAETADGASNAYVFYDGPPFANGLPHHGHILTGYVKDAVARYQTMLGKRVERRFGWDCHGLPAEMETEKQLGVSGRQEIMTYGVEKFNEHCRTSVMRYRDEWEFYVGRQARWVDFENDYKTMDTPYMESVLWAFSELYKKGLIYEGFKVMPYSWSAETVLSSSEIRLDDATREKVDKAVTVAFKLKEKPVGAPVADEYYLLAWTTTPWTLPSNLALAVSGEINYCAYVKDSDGNSPLEGESKHESVLVGGHQPLATKGYAENTADHARAMRKEMTKEEYLLWEILRDNQLGVKFRRQQPIGAYIADFYSAEALLIVEVDGSQHAENSKDAARDAWLKAEGYSVLRFWNNDVRQNKEGVVESILAAVNLTPHDSASGDALASSAPPQGGSYGQSRVSKTCYILASSATTQYLDITSKGTRTTKDASHTNVSPDSIINGKSLIGLSYEPLFPYFSDHPNAFRVLDGSSFIEEGSGTGIVHMAPGFGEDDMRVCAENGISVVVPVDEKGRYTDAIYDLRHPEQREGSPATSRDSSAMPQNDSGTFETARCILKTPTVADEANFIALHTNETVMDTVNDGIMTEAQARADFAANLAHFNEHGYGQWAVYHRETGAFMGRAGLSFAAQSDEMPAKPTLRCALMPEFWHGGYGTELCHAAIAYGFETRHMPEIAGGAVAKNVRSHEMMKRLGMKFIRTMMFKRTEGPYFLMTKAEWNDAVIPAKAGIQKREELDSRLRGNDNTNTLSLRGLNVIKETEKLSNEEREDQAKYGKTSKYRHDKLEQFGLANIRIAEWLKKTGHLIKEDNEYKHNYPHCWRTDKPIIYKAMSSWFVDVPKIRDRMVELNQDINWIPSHIKDGRFGKWLEGAREWSISRSRFWGCPIPVWRSDNPENKELYVFGSVAELEAFFGVTVTDLHKPVIDTLTKPDPTNSAYTIKRVDEVFDCWFESGSMPFAQVHYPFENKAWFEANFPADFIVEYEAQTRGWFYNMMVLSVGLFDSIPFKNCICHGVVLDEKGRKLSKRLKNYIDPKELFETYGSDSLRWFMLSSTIMRGNELFLDAEGAFIRDAVRLYIKPLWNAYHFFCLYANADGARAEFDLTSDNLMDRYILAKLKACVDGVRAALDAYDTPAATTAISAFLEVLNNWYIRRNRARFWGTEQGADKVEAYNTLYSVLHTLCRIAAPFLPQVTEAMYRGLTVPSPASGGGLGWGCSDETKGDTPLPTSPRKQGEELVSVHLADYPIEFAALQADKPLMQAMDRVQDICNTAHAIRNEVGIRIRQPLASLTVYGFDISQDIKTLDYFSFLISDEVNVKRTNFNSDFESVATRKLKIHFPTVGKRLPTKMKDITAAGRNGDWSFTEGGEVSICGEILTQGEFEFTLESTIKVGAAALSAQDGLVVLDTALSDALTQEGIARDIVRLVQQSRKEAGFDVGDRIELVVEAVDDVAVAASAFAAYICEQTLSTSLHVGSASASRHPSEHELNGQQIRLGLQTVVREAKAG